MHPSVCLPLPALRLPLAVVSLNVHLLLSPSPGWNVCGSMCLCVYGWISVPVGLSFSTSHVHLPAALLNILLLSLLPFLAARWVSVHLCTCVSAREPLAHPLSPSPGLLEVDPWGGFLLSTHPGSYVPSSLSLQTSLLDGFPGNCPLDTSRSVP